jgi:hypothetical protein
LLAKEPKAKRASFEQRMQGFLSGYEKKLRKLGEIVKIAEEQAEGLTKWKKHYEESID